MTLWVDAPSLFPTFGSSTFTRRSKRSLASSTKTAPLACASGWGCTTARRSACCTVTQQASTTSATWFVTSRDEYLSSLKGLGAAYREVIGRYYPAMTLVQVVALVEARAKVEIEATAVIPSRSTQEVSA